VDEGLEGAPTPHRTTRKYQSLLDGAQEAHLIALACGYTPQEYRRWRLHVLANEMVKMDYVEEISHETVRRVICFDETPFQRSGNK
jgi:hypothetical protein